MTALGRTTARPSERERVPHPEFAPFLFFYCNEKLGNGNAGDENPHDVEMGEVMNHLIKAKRDPVRTFAGVVKATQVTRS
jgi:hypothetical protein